MRECLMFWCLFMQDLFSLVVSVGRRGSCGYDDTPSEGIYRGSGLA